MCLAFRAAYLDKPNNTNFRAQKRKYVMTKSLSKAIALATMLGAAASAQAININQDGLGEVLLYSLYTTEEGNITNINVTNTTDKVKAVKVRFVEGQNSQEVLDFNLYLSPFDQWSGAVTQTDAGAKLITADKSCTAPAIPAGGVDFRSFGYKGDGGEQSAARTRVGHLEVIEMGVIDPTYLTPAGKSLAGFATANHTVPGSAPADCGALRAQFSGTGIWAAGALQTGFLDAAAVKADNLNGGLYGSADILNIEGSTQISYDALAIDNFMDDTVDGPQSTHQVTGSVDPSLNGGGNNFATFKNGVVAEYVNSASAVTALLMKESINNDYVLDAGRGSETNWVITFPTKRFHVDTFAVGDEAPFVNRWNKTTGKSCHEVGLQNWDNEEYAGAPSDLDFSPAPPGATSSLCYETNILTFNKAKVLGGEFVSYDVSLTQPDFQFGWMSLAFVADGVNAYTLESEDTPAVVTNGLPAIGFSAVTIRNNSTANGVMNNYGSSTSHKSKTTHDHL